MGGLHTMINKMMYQNFDHRISLREPARNVFFAGVSYVILKEQKCQLIPVGIPTALGTTVVANHATPDVAKW